MESQTSIDTIESARKWTSQVEVEQLLKGAKKSRNPIRDGLIILMLYRHGLRSTELCNITLNMVDLELAQLQVHRIKQKEGSKKDQPYIHPIAGDELRHIKRYLRVRKKNTVEQLPYLFTSEQGNQISRSAVKYAVAQASERAEIRHIHPHMLRHGCGYYLANMGMTTRDIQVYLGHKNIQNTAIYTAVNPKRFMGIWDK